MVIEIFRRARVLVGAPPKDCIKDIQPPMAAILQKKPALARCNLPRACHHHGSKDSNLTPCDLDWIMAACKALSSELVANPEGEIC
jgi:hypothetical protein